MRALIICDKVDPRLYSPAIKERVGEIDLIISCGDLPFYYIEFIVSMLNKPCYFVFGNHGHVAEYQGEDWIKVTGPGGAQNLHLKSVKEGPLLLAGLEGSMRYNSAPRFQYTDTQMWSNVFRLMPQLLYNRIRYGRWLDVLVAHSPPRGIHDEQDRAHTGFTSFLKLMAWFKPRYLLHGHIHIYRNNVTTETRYLDTDVINVYPYRILDLEPAAK
ncbi:MAG: metallophosphoesterase [Chloroflexota bacterium]